MRGLPWGSLSTIRVRLTAALAIALLPVLLVGILQSAIVFRREGFELQSNLGLAAQRSAAAAQARLQSAEILLETLAPGVTGAQCSGRLAELTHKIPGYSNLIRFNAQGQAVCAAAPTPLGARAPAPWFQRLARGEPLVITREPAAAYAVEPSVLAAIREEAPGGRFAGAFAAAIPLRSLKPPADDPSLPRGAEVALANAQGRYIDATSAPAFAPLPDGWRDRLAKDGAMVWYARDARGDARVYSAAPAVSGDLFVVLSARSPGLLSWARLNPLTGVIFPLLSFALALAAVAFVADRVVVRWIAYLQRIAALYAKGRLSVRPIQADQMPPEIRQLAGTLEDMADAIVGRDASLRDSLAQKDALMREIHHRVKNNLQVISSLLNMQQRALADPAARAAMSDTRQRITALALIYRALYQGPDLKRVDLRPFLEELTAQLIAGEMLHGPPVRTDLSVDALVIDPDRLAPLALFAVEAITNAQKHAFASRGGILTVNFHVHGDEAELEISDDGHASDEALVASGVGRTLMTAFARQLRGRAEIIRNPSGGMTARLIFPTPSLENAAHGAPAGNQAAA